jgi:cold shock CspA family protein
MTACALPDSDWLFSQSTGVVVSFEEHAGLGLVRSDTGSVLAFHCISIADGTRTIQNGQAVLFEVAFRVKRVEAINLRSL